MVLTDSEKQQLQQALEEVVAENKLSTDELKQLQANVERKMNSGAAYDELIATVKNAKPSSTFDLSTTIKSVSEFFKNPLGSISSAMNNSTAGKWFNENIGNMFTDPQAWFNSRLVVVKAWFKSQIPIWKTWFKARLVDVKNWIVGWFKTGIANLKSWWAAKVTPRINKMKSDFLPWMKQNWPTVAASVAGLVVPSLLVLR